MTKVDIVDALRKRFGYTRYLELTCDVTGHRYAEAKAVGFATCMRLVYNAPEGMHRDGLPTDFWSPTSDILACLAEIERQALTFDVMLVDSYHAYDVSLRDLRAAYQLTRRGGAIVIHDCLPPRKETASPLSRDGEWCGVSYRAFLDFCLANPAFDYFTIDTDYGCGVIIKSTSPTRVGKNMIRAIRQRSLAREWKRVGANYDTLFELLQRRKFELLRLGGPALLDHKLSAY